MLLVTLEPPEKLLPWSSSSSSSFEHWTNAARNGSLRKLSRLSFFRIPISSKLILLEIDAGAAGGGNGRTFNVDSFFLLLWFLGIPGKCSHENGTPENWSGVAGLRGESSRKRKDEHDESDEDDEKDAVRREESVLVAGNVVSQSFGTFRDRSLRVAEESITSEKERRDKPCFVS